MDNLAKFEGKYNSLIARHKDLQHLNVISKMTQSSKISLESEIRELEEFIPWFKQQKDTVRSQYGQYLELKASVAPSGAVFVEKINEFRTKIFSAWRAISMVCQDIYSQRKQLFEEREKFKNK